MLKKKDLTDRCIQGDRKAQRKFYELHKAGLYYLCLRYARNPEDAKDILQEGFMQIFRDMKQYDSAKGDIKPWTNRIMINTALRYNRNNYKISFLSNADSVELADIGHGEEYEDSAYTAKEILALVQELPDGYRTVFNLYVVDGFTHKEISEYLGISVNTSKSQLSKAKTTLRTHLTKVKKQKYIALL